MNEWYVNMVILLAFEQVRNKKRIQALKIVHSTVVFTLHIMSRVSIGNYSKHASGPLENAGCNFHFALSTRHQLKTIILAMK